MSRLPLERQRALRNEQRAWLKQRDLKCQEEAKEVEGGSMWTSIYEGCRATLTEQRKKAIQAFR